MLNLGNFEAEVVCHIFATLRDINCLFLGHFLRKKQQHHGEKHQPDFPPNLTFFLAYHTDIK